MQSIWHRDVTFPRHPSLEGKHHVEVGIIGGGLAGILTAALLKEEGVDAVILEADRVGSGQTGNTTAKVTSQHGAIYHKLEKAHGPETARLYAMANQRAVDQYRQLIARRHIPCCWEEREAWLYSTVEDSLLVEEAAAQERAGLPAYFTEDTELPFPVKGAVRCAGQASFHPLALLRTLADELTIYEDSRVLAVEGNTLRTAQGELNADQIVFACHYPFLNVPGYYFLRMHQSRSYVVALSGAPRLRGMYYSVDPGGLSLRPAWDLLLVGGGGHRTGENKGGGRYEALRRSAALLFPGAQEAVHWSAQDCMTLDGLPYVGAFSAGPEPWWVATGFGKWGMTGSMVSALLLRDALLGLRMPEWGNIFSPQRFTPSASAGAFLNEGVHAVRGLGKQLLAPAKAMAETLPPGHGGIVEIEGEKVGLYKAPNSAAYLVNIRCPHLGCQLTWNPDEESWDCPCHGSRFDCRGRILSGPAQENLEAWRLDQGAT